MTSQHEEGATLGWKGEAPCSDVDVHVHVDRFIGMVGYHDADQKLQYYRLLN